MTTPHNGMVGTKTYLNVATLPELSEDMAALRYAGIRGIETIRHAFALRLGSGEVFLRGKVGTVSALRSRVPVASARRRRSASAGFAAAHGTRVVSFGRRTRKRGGRKTIG